MKYKCAYCKGSCMVLSKCKNCGQMECSKCARKCRDKYSKKPK